MLHLALQRLISYRFVCISLHTSCLPLQKLTQEIVILIRVCRPTVVGLLFVFVVKGAGVRRATYLFLDSTRNVDKNWDINVSFIIHVNVDHAWAEHYPVTLNLSGPGPSIDILKRQSRVSFLSLFNFEDNSVLIRLTAEIHVHNQQEQLVQQPQVYTFVEQVW